MSFKRMNLVTNVRILQRQMRLRLWQLARYSKRIKDIAMKASVLNFDIGTVLPPMSPDLQFEPDRVRAITKTQRRLGWDDALLMLDARLARMTWPPG